MTKKIILPYFPKGLKYVTPLFFIGGIFLMIKLYPVWGVLAVLIGVIILTTNYVTEIDLAKKKYSDYLSLLGLRVNNEVQTFRTIDRIIITKGNYTQAVNTRIQSRTIKWTDFTGTLFFDNNKTLNLLTHNKKKELVAELNHFAAFYRYALKIAQRLIITGSIKSLLC